jgi:hypothetical protein
MRASSAISGTPRVDALPRMALRLSGLQGWCRGEAARCGSGLLRYPRNDVATLRLFSARSSDERTGRADALPRMALR